MESHDEFSLSPDDNVKGPSKEQYFGVGLGLEALTLLAYLISPTAERFLYYPGLLGAALASPQTLWIAKNLAEKVLRHRRW